LSGWAAADQYLLFGVSAVSPRSAGPVFSESAARPRSLAAKLPGNGRPSWVQSPSRNIHTDPSSQKTFACEYCPAELMTWTAATGLLIGILDLL
jgi:hypothetical protein